MTDEILDIEPEDKEPNSLVARVERDDLKSLFYLLAGKPDSLVKVLGGDVIVDKKCLHNLNARIKEKLQHHEVEGLVASVHIGSSGNVTKEFSDWADFEQYRLDGGEETESISLRWDFMVKLPRYQAPQRHTVTVRLSETPNPADVLKILAASDPEDHSAAEYLGAPIVCRVDFINALLSDEIVNIVESWHEGLAKPPVSSKRIKWLMRHSGTVHETIHRLFEVLFASIACVTLWQHEGQISLRSLAIWLLASIVFVNFAGSFGHWVAVALERAVRSMRTGLIFKLTNGDRNRERKRAGAAKKSWLSFSLRTVFALIVNTAAGLLTAWILSS